MRTAFPAGLGEPEQGFRLGSQPDVSCLYCKRKAQWLVVNHTGVRPACGRHVETAKDTDLATVRHIDPYDSKFLAGIKTADDRRSMKHRGRSVELGAPTAGDDWQNGAVFQEANFEEILHPRGRGGRWIFKGIVSEFRGEVGNRDHITRTENGEISTAAIAHLRGEKGEVPGAHRNKTGADWEKFVDEVRPGVREPIFITVDHGDEPKISEGNHRRDAAVEAGLDMVPVEIRYFGHAEQEGTVLDRARAKEEPSWTQEADQLVGLMRQFLTLRAHSLGDRAKEMHYLGWEDLVLKHGFLFKHGSTESRIERDFHATTAQQCFTNAMMAAVSHPDLTYVEGFAFNGILPVHHAWVVDKDGRVYDPTWENIEGRDGTRDVYIGVPFTTDYLTQTVMAKGTDTLLDEWGEGVKLTEPLPPDALATVKGIPVPEHLQGPDSELLAQLRGHKLGESVFDPFKHPRGRLGRWIGTLGERERHAVERAMSSAHAMVEPGDLIRGDRRRGGQGRKGLKVPAKQWRAKVEAARAVPVIGQDYLKAAYSTASARQNDASLSEEDRAIARNFTNDYWGAPGQRGLYGSISGMHPGSLFEEQHTRIMEAGAGIDAEVARRIKPAQREYAAVAKAAREARAEKKRISKEDERLRAEVAVEILQRDFGWYDPERVASLNEPKPWLLSSEQTKFDPVEDATKRWRTYLREKRKDREAQMGKRSRGGDAVLMSANQDVALAFYRAENDPRVQESGDRRRAAGIKMFETENERDRQRLKLNVARRDAAYEVLREVRQFAEPGSAIIGQAYPDTLVSARALERAQEAVKWLPKDWIDDSDIHQGATQKKLVADLAQRGKYISHWTNPLSGEEASALIGTTRGGVEPPLDAEGVGYGVGVMVHEWVHRSEGVRDGIKGAEWTFYTGRVSPYHNASWEQARPLNEIEGVDSYRPDEKARSDDFVEVYSGKTYGDDMTSPWEILSTGIEDLVTGSHRIVEQDDEHRQFVYGALAVL